MAAGCLHQRCRWVRDRLPLLVGGELVGLDRRDVERHLIACRECRREHASLTGAIEALHAAALPATADVPAVSLWPALERQIHEARHAPRAWAPFAWLSEIGAVLEGLVSPARSRLRLTPLSALVLAVGIAAAGVDLWARWRIAADHTQIVAADHPIDVGYDDDPFWDLAPPIPFDLASGAGILAQVEPPSGSTLVSAADRPAPARVDYDLDHGTPMEPDAVDAKASY